MNSVEAQRKLKGFLKRLSAFAKLHNAELREEARDGISEGPNLWDTGKHVEPTFLKRRGVASFLEKGTRVATWNGLLFIWRAVKLSRSHFEGAGAQRAEDVRAS